MAMQLYKKIMNIDGLGDLITEFVDEVEKGELRNIEKFFWDLKTDWDNKSPFFNRIFQIPDCVEKENGISEFYLPMDTQIRVFVEERTTFNDLILRNHGHFLNIIISSCNISKHADYRNYRHLINLLNRYYTLREEYGPTPEQFNNIDIEINSITKKK